MVAVAPGGGAVKRRPLVYVAGPYTNPDPVLNTRRAIQIGDVLWRKGAVPLIPHLSIVWHLVCPRPLEDWYEIDLHLLDRCDALLRLWGDSTGANAEVNYAHEAGVPVFLEPGIGGGVPSVLVGWIELWRP